MTYPYITVSKGMAGFFAVMVTNVNGFPEPECTGPGRYELQANAIDEGKEWAESEGLPFFSPAIDSSKARQDVEQQIRELIPDVQIIHVDDHRAP